MALLYFIMKLYSVLRTAVTAYVSYLNIIVLHVTAGTLPSFIKLCQFHDNFFTLKSNASHFLVNFLGIVLKLITAFNLRKQTGFYQYGRRTTL